MRFLVILAYALATLTVSAFFAPDARAVNLTWNAAGGGNADTAANWTPSQIPGLADDLTFGLGSTYAVNWDDTISNVDTIDVSAGTVTLLDAGDTDLTTTGLFEVGDNSGGVATLLLKGGTWTAGSSVRIGFQAADDGQLEVLGDALFNTPTIAVGFRGDGELILTQGTITATGNLNAASATTGATNGTALIEVGDTFSVSGTTNLGASAGGTATLRVNSGKYTSGGATTINAGSLLEVLGGKYNADNNLTLASATSTLTVNGGELNANAGLNNSAAGNLNHLDGTLTVTGGAFQPNAGGVADDYTIEGPSAVEAPHVVLGVGATASVGDRLTIGYENRGMLTVTDGGSISSTLGVIADISGSTGSATVNGNGSTWTNTSNLRIGRFGNGTLNIQNGGTVSSLDSFVGGTVGAIGTVTVDNTGSNWATGILHIGSLGSGTMTIQNGGAVTSVLGVIGNNSGSTGAVTVDDAGSSWTLPGGMFLGQSGNGTLNIQNGGSVSNTNAVIGNLSGSMGTATVDGAGSTWTNSGVMEFGRLSGSDGTLIVQNGGTVSNAIGFIGASTGSTGTATVDGSGSTWTNTNALYVGGDSVAARGTGSLTVQNSGIVNVANLTKIWNPGTLTINGGSFNANGGLDNSDVGVLNHLDGTLTVTGGAFQPNAGGATDDYTIEGPTAAEMPHLVLGAGATANIGRDLDVGETNRGMLTVTDGATVSNVTGRIGVSSGSTGMVTVDGAGSTWTNSNILLVGKEGTGTLNIQDGAAVSSTTGVVGPDPGSIGTVLVDGAGSTWTNSGTLLVGHFGNTGTLTVQNGATISNTDGIIGTSSGTIGTVTVAGTGSTWTNSIDLNVGLSGNGTLNIQSGATVTNGIGTIGESSGSTSTATVDGNGSTWANSNILFVGKDGSGTLNIQNGATVSNTMGIVGTNPGSTGTVFLDGAGSTWTNSSVLLVGHFGNNGTLTIQNGATVSNTIGIIATSAVGTATVDGAGSTWTNTSGLYVGGTDTAAGGTGSLSVQNNGLVEVDGELKVWAPGTLNLSGGTIDVETLDLNEIGSTFNMTGGRLVAETVNGDLTNQGGTLAPGQSSGTPSPGMTTINGDYDQQAGTLEIELGGLIAGTEFDRLDITGDVSLAGTLNVSLFGGFALGVGDAFEFINIDGTRSGTFAGLSEGALVGSFGGTDLFISYTAGDGNDVSLSTASLPGDYNSDGTVDAADYTVWRDNEGAVAGTLPNDADGGVIGAAQYSSWVANFGATASLSTSVPEPSGLAMLMCMTVSLASQRKRAGG